MFFFDPVYLLIMAPVLLFTLYAQFKVNRTYKKYADITPASGVTGAQAGRRLLDTKNLTDVAIEEVPGKLTDHYDPRTRILRLSTGVYGSSSISALGIAAHEAGHAVQDRTKYWPMAVRSGLVPVANIGSQMAWPLFFLGIIMVGWFRTPYGYLIMYAAILVFAAAVMFYLVTLPVEFNASRRGLAMLSESGLVTEEERYAARRVLSAAAMTYLAAAATAVMTLLYMIIRAQEQ